MRTTVATGAASDFAASSKVALRAPFDLAYLAHRLRAVAGNECMTDTLDPREASLARLAMSAEARDTHSEGHCERLAVLAVSVGESLGLPSADLMALQWGALLHDIGNVAIPDSILFKPGRLTEDEYDLVKQHTLIGDQLCVAAPSLAAARRIVRQHHERLDGSGYPDGLHGSEISLLAQIVGIVDTFDAMTMPRSYRQALPAELALESLRADAARGAIRGVLVDAFERVLLTA